MDKIKSLIPWAAAVFIAAIFLDSLRFKFTGHPTPEHIFTTLRDWSGIGLFFPAGPWIVGIAELLASLLVLILPLILVFMGNKTKAHGMQWLGALIGIGVMTGAIIFHLFTPLGIETPTEWANGEPVESGPFLFYSACATWLCCLLILIWRRHDIPAWVPVLGRAQTD